VVATLHPNHTYEKVVFNPWWQVSWDVNDTVTQDDPAADPDVGDFFKRLPTANYSPTWRVTAAGSSDKWLQDAATKAAAHADTPTTAYFDALGRTFLTIARNRVVCPGHPLDGAEDSFATRVELDLEGNQREVRDERKLAANYLPTGAIEQRIVMQYDYDMLGNRIHQLSMEAGARWMLNDVAGKPIRAWDSRGHNLTTAYDALRRPIEQFVRGTFNDPDPLKPNSDPRTLNPRDIRGWLVDKIEYGEPPLDPTATQEQEAQRLNLRTRVYRHSDSAGVTTNARLDAKGKPTEGYDFKGNLLRSTRQLASDYTAIPDWLNNPNLEIFESSTCYDALNRPFQTVAPYSSVTRAEHPNKFNVIQPVFNEAKLLERVDVWLESAAEPGALLDPHTASPGVGITNIDYDAKGQRLRIDYKNNASTFYSYDPLTFRLTQLETRRGAADFPGDDPQPPIDGWPGKQVQNLHYTYDPAGNITHIKDDAQQTIFFRNQRVEPSNDYVYDALYRLIQAEGREHLGQLASGDRKPPTAPEAFDTFHTRLDHPGNGQAMGTYIERYVYDAVGNFLQMQHRGSFPSDPGWTRAYDYLDPSLIEDGNRGVPLKTSNRLTRTTLNPAGNLLQPEAYLHDAHGNMLRMPHLGDGSPGTNMKWDYKDRLLQADLGGGGTAYYVYDASGQRVRKVVEKNKGSLIEERIYFGGFEIYRKHEGAVPPAISANTATLERETLHVMDDKQRIALVETRTLDTNRTDKAPRQLIRYQFGNHLGSVSLELDDQAQIISYEEYSPYGSTTYQAVRSQTEASKRYRYTGKERDEESGFYYYGARYYAPWLGMWTACDPIGIADAPSLYRYTVSSPVRHTDSTGNQTESSATKVPRSITFTDQDIHEHPHADVSSPARPHVCANGGGDAQTPHLQYDISGLLKRTPQSPFQVDRSLQLLPPLQPPGIPVTVPNTDLFKDIPALKPNEPPQTSENWTSGPKIDIPNLPRGPLPFLKWRGFDSDSAMIAGFGVVFPGGTARFDLGATDQLTVDSPDAPDSKAYGVGKENQKGEHSDRYSSDYREARHRLLGDVATYDWLEPDPGVGGAVGIKLGGDATLTVTVGGAPAKLPVMGDAPSTETYNADAPRPVSVTGFENVLLRQRPFSYNLNKDAGWYLGLSIKFQIGNQ
jgi:RHS repeat-associated protein